MGKNSVPEGWNIYTNCGNVVIGTRFLPFKVPLRKEICQNLDSKDQEFTLNNLFELHSNFSLIIDLTKTQRYYNSEDIKNRNIKYVKLEAEGHGQLPSNRDYGRFFESISEHLKIDKSDGLIGIHCTHGLNRTGYFICRYMIDTLSITGEEAISRFEEARGHKICRDNYRDYLLNYKPSTHQQIPFSIEDCSSYDNRYQQSVPYGSYRSFKDDKRRHNEINDNRVPTNYYSSYRSYREAKYDRGFNSYNRYDISRTEFHKSRSRSPINSKHSKYSDWKIYNPRSPRQGD